MTNRIREFLSFAATIASYTLLVVAATLLALNVTWLIFAALLLCSVGVAWWASGRDI